VDFDLNPDFFAEVVIGLADKMAAKLTIFSPAFCCAARKTISCAIFSGANNKKGCDCSLFYYSGNSLPAVKNRAF
jgi:hypothetical protein